MYMLANLVGKACKYDIKTLIESRVNHSSLAALNTLQKEVNNTSRLYLFVGNLG